jgi:hypothetical protein
MEGRIMSKELGGTWKGAVLAYFNVHDRHFPGETEENHKQA